MKKEKYNFRKIKQLINDKNDTKKLIDGFYYNNKAINFVNNLKKDFFLNKYYNLKTIDILLMIDEAIKIDDVLKNLLIGYEKDYAFSVWRAFLYSMEWEG